MGPRSFLQPAQIMSDSPSPIVQVGFPFSKKVDDRAFSHATHDDVRGDAKVRYGLETFKNVPLEDGVGGCHLIFFQTLWLEVKTKARIQW